VRAIPGLVLDGVVEYPCAAHLPFAPLAADAKRAALGNDERQVDGDARVGNTGVRRYVRVSVENREEYGRCVSGHITKRRTCERCGSARAPRQVLRAWHALVP